MRLETWIALLLLVLAAGWSTPAGAQAGGPQAFAAAQAAFARGERLFAEGAYDRAEVEFRGAYDLMRGHPNQPLILANVARCVEQQRGRAREALTLYERMVRDTEALATTNAGARDARRDAQARIAALRARGVGGGRGVSTVGLVLAGAGAAVMIAGAVTGGLALAARDSVLATCADGRCPPQREADAIEIEALALATDVLLFGGLALAAAGVVLTFVLPVDGALAAGAACGPTGCLATLEGRFH